MLTRAAGSDWEQYKDVIGKLYREKPLKDVISIMKAD
jgi:hypothetical protein